MGDPKEHEEIKTTRIEDQNTGVTTETETKIVESGGEDSGEGEGGEDEAD